MSANPDTIFALATPVGRAGIAVVRVSGPQAASAIEQLTRSKAPAERRAVYRRLFDSSSGSLIDAGLVLFFPSPHSYTGEDSAEFQIHGGRAVAAALLRALAVLPGLRPAEPGEFTRRAVENGRLDLTQAEAIADLVDAETQAQHRLALRQLGGHLAAVYEAWRARLIHAAAWIEAGIDFADEDIPPEAAESSRAALHSILGEIQAHLNDGRRGELLREGLHVAIIGPPNAGKSSLLNALAQRDAAIVSEIPGTTRDVIEVHLNLGGYPVILADTAGLRDSEDRIEQEGVRRARARAEVADLRILVLDGTAPAHPDVPADIIVWNKADIVPTRPEPGLWISAKTGEGVDMLIRQLTGAAAERLEPPEAPILTRARHRVALEAAARDIAASIETTEPELAAEHLRAALRSIGRITGRVDLDELLDVVFRDFCIGK
jgi:tRNA modification GTPase